MDLLLETDLDLPDELRLDEYDDDRLDLESEERDENDDSLDIDLDLLYLLLLSRDRLTDLLEFTFPVETFRSRSTSLPLGRSKLRRESLLTGLRLRLYRPAGPAYLRTKLSIRNR